MQPEDDDKRLWGVFDKNEDAKHTMRIWITRLLVLAVFAVNVYCALSFILFPEQSIGAYELTGASGIAAIQGIGFAFLMWNATYPPVIIKPARQRVLFLVIIFQQVIGLVGDAIIYYQLPEVHLVLAESILRFIIFDSAGLVLLILGFFLTRKRKVA